MNDLHVPKQIKKLGSWVSPTCLLIYSWRYSACALVVKRPPFFWDRRQHYILRYMVSNSNGCHILWRNLYISTGGHGYKKALASSGFNCFVGEPLLQILTILRQANCCDNCFSIRLVYSRALRTEDVGELWFKPLYKQHSVYILVHVGDEPKSSPHSSATCSYLYLGCE